MKKVHPVNTRVPEMLKFIREYYGLNGIMPTIREIGEAVNVSSTSVTRYYLSTLEKQGHIKIIPAIARGIQLVIGHDVCPMCGSLLKGGLHALPDAGVHKSGGIEGRKDVRHKQSVGLFEVSAVNFPKREHSRRNGADSTSRQGGVIQLSK